MRVTVRALQIISVTAALLTAAACSGGSDSSEGATGESWCDVVAASNALDDEFDEVQPDDAGGLKSVLDEISGLGDRFRAAAPDEISGQVDTYADTNDALVQVFADAEYDMLLVDRDAIGTVLAAVDGADTEIDVYTVAECGVPLGPDDT